MPRSRQVRADAGDKGDNLEEDERHKAKDTKPGARRPDEYMKSELR